MRGHGTHKTAFQNLSGRTFGHWVVGERAPNKSSRTHWHCQCACGNHRVVSAIHLVRGASTNCGCSKPRGSAHVNFKHGMKNDPVYSVWMAMNARCNAKTGENYKKYGQRGIAVCERWKDFKNFYTDMGPRPSLKHSIDRKNNDMGYHPDNCRWATPKQQARNNRRNVLIEMEGQIKPLSEWCEIKEQNYSKIKYRIQVMKLSPVDAFTHGPFK